MHCRGHHVRRLNYKGRVSKGSSEASLTGCFVLVGEGGDATYLRTCIRSSRLVCCTGSPDSRAGRPVLNSARRSPDLAVGIRERWDGWMCTLMDAMAVVEVQPGGDAVDERC